MARKIVARKDSDMLDGLDLKPYDMVKISPEKAMVFDCEEDGLAAAEKGKAMGLLKNALAEAAKVADPFEAQKIRRLIGMGLARLDPGGSLPPIAGYGRPILSLRNPGGCPHGTIVHRS
jgi:hypothetical protein